MKYTFTYETLEGLDKVLSVVANKDSATVLSLGTKDLEKLLVCSARITTNAEEIIMQATCEKPSDWKEDSETVTLAFKSEKFSGVIQSLLSFKEKVFISVDGASVLIGVEGRAQVPVEILSEVPQAIKRVTPFMSFGIEGAAFAAFSKKGLLMTDDQPSPRGAQNAMIVVNADTGDVVGCSSEGHIMARATTKVKMASASESNPTLVQKLKEMNEALDAYCEKANQKRDAFVINIPGESVRHLRTLTEGQKGFAFDVTDKHLICKLGNVAVYTAVQGAVTPLKIELVEQIMAQEGDAVAQFDSETLIKGIDFVNKINSLDQNEQTYAIDLNLTDALLKASSGATGQIATNIKVAAKSGADSEARVRGRYFKNVLTSLLKGNVIVRFLPQMIIVQNGTIGEPDVSGSICITQVKKADDTEAAETKDDTTESAE